MKYVGKQLVLYIYTYHILYLLSKYFCIYYAHLYLYFIAGNSSFKNQLKTRTLLEVSRKTVVRGWFEKKITALSHLLKNGILQVWKRLLRVSMIEGEHYTTMAEIFCVDKPSMSDWMSEAKWAQETLGESTQKIEAIIV